MSILFRRVAIPLKGPPLSVTGRILALQSQFSLLGLQLVGIQEGRMRTSALRVCPEYFFGFVSPAKADGCHGCELWVSTTIPGNDNNANATTVFHTF